jgi:prolipoprotein diacylglyceryl transferase
VKYSIPTPTISVVEIGPLTIHAYALCIIAGVTLAIWLSNKRFVSAFPDATGVVGDVAIVAVPAGVLGGRIYHVITTPERFFGAEGNFLDAFKIWQGGLGIWGAISLGALGAFLAYRKIAHTRELPSFIYFADAVAPGIIFAQAIGRWGNWFNGELFGKPTQLPWALEIPSHLRPSGYTSFATFHPTFLYESLWSLALGFVLLRLTNKVATGQIFTLYVGGYCLGRLGMEFLRIDTSHHLFGLRINAFVAALGIVAATWAFRNFSKRPR